MMENESLKVNKMSESESAGLKHKVTAVHAVGIQDLYKAEFSQESDCNLNNLKEKPMFLSTNLKDESEEKFFYNCEKMMKINENEKPDQSNKNFGFDETYQLLKLKGLQYSADFIKTEENCENLSNLEYETCEIEDFIKPEENCENLSNLEYETCKIEENLPSNILDKPVETFQNDLENDFQNDKDIQIHLVKPDGIPINFTTSQNSSTSIKYNLENFEYTGDAQILHRYLCDYSNVLLNENNNHNPPVENVTINLVNKQNNNLLVKSIYDVDSVGVNPEMLGIRFEDCDFNSSDSFASTESIIPKNIMCPKCPKKFMFKSDLLKHDKYKHSSKPKLLCKYCGKEFGSKQNLFFHEKSHKRKKIYKCELCKKVFKKSGVLIKHLLNKHSETNPFLCSHCTKVFSSEILLNNHLKKIHLPTSNKPFKCKFCSKSFEKKKGLSSHAKAHPEDHSFACQYCNKSFTKFCYLKNHERSHLNEEKNSFVCEKCGKDFKTQGALKKHCRKHTGEKPFTCNVCMKQFACKAYFKVHIKKHPEVKLYSCDLCSETFISLTDLNKHEKSHSKEKSYRCVTFNQNFCQESNLRNHWKSQNCNINKYQDVCTQTTGFSSSSTMPNVNVIVNQIFTNQSPIVLTSFGNFVNSNPMPIILTQNSDKS